jgi:methylglutaconyl-CoA hydratase
MNYIQYTKANRIGTIVLNRPDKRNALNYDVVSELKASFAMAEDDPEVKVVVLMATGESFCAGADLGYLQEMQRFTYEENLSDSEHLKDLFHKIYTLKKVVIAQVEGDAIAGGCGLVTCCDFVFSVPKAKFGYTEVKIGFIPAMVTVFLLRRIGPGKTREMLLTGNLLSADDALNLGLINQVNSVESIQQDVVSFAEKLIATNSANSMMLTKQLLAEVASMNLPDALQYACQTNAIARASDDCKRGIAAFLNKEKIIW